MKKKFYHNKDLVIISDGERSAVYSDSQRKLLNVDTLKFMELFAELNANKFKFDKSYDNPFLNSLINKGLIFTSRINYNSSIITKKYMELTREVDLQVAYLHVTQRCNLLCTYCYNTQNLNKPDLLTYDDWINVIKKLKGVGVNTFVFTGGEICLRRDLLELLKFVNYVGGHSRLLTNGTLLNNFDNALYELLESVIVSIDHLDPKINNKYRIGSLKYDILGNLKNIDPVFRDKIFVRSVISKNNISDSVKLKV